MPFGFKARVYKPAHHDMKLKGKLSERMSDFDRGHDCLIPFTCDVGFSVSI